MRHSFYACAVLAACSPLYAGQIDFTGHSVVYRPDTDDVRFTVRFQGDPADLLRVDESGQQIDAFQFFVYRPISPTRDTIVSGGELVDSSPNIWIRDPQQSSAIIAEVPYQISPIKDSQMLLEFAVPLSTLTTWYPDGVFPYAWETYRNGSLTYHVLGTSQFGIPEPSSLLLGLLMIVPPVFLYLKRSSRACCKPTNRATPAS